MTKMFYAATYAYGKRMINHGLRADYLHAATDAAKLGGAERVTRKEAIRLFGTEALREARRVGGAATHVCDGSCRR